MVHDRKEPTFSKVSKAESNSRSVNRPASASSQANPIQANSTRASSNNVAPRPRADTRPQVMIQKQSSGLLWLALFVAILAAAAGGYLFWQFNEAQQTIAEQQGRLVELENKLLLSDDESTQSLTALTANVRGLNENVTLAMSEVDKLWATRNASLKKLATATSELNKRIDTTGEQSKKVIDGANKQLKQSLVIIKQSSSEQEFLIQSLRERVSEQSQTIGKIQSILKQNSNGTEKLAMVTQDLAQLEEKLTTFSRRTKEYDEAIESFDQFRILTNRDLMTLKNRAGIAPQ
jgi:hypothetical protein